MIASASLASLVFLPCFQVDASPDTRPVQSVYDLAVLVEHPHEDRLIRVAEWRAGRGWGSPTLSATIILPETHESERVGRVTPGSNSFLLWNSGAAAVRSLKVTYVDHGVEEMIVLVDQSPTLLTDIGLPVDAWCPCGQSMLPQMARFDRVGPGHDCHEALGSDSGARDSSEGLRVLGIEGFGVKLAVSETESRELYSLRQFGDFMDMFVFGTRWPQQLQAEHAPLEGELDSKLLGFADQVFLASPKTINATPISGSLELRVRDLEADHRTLGREGSRPDAYGDWGASPQQLLEVRWPTQPEPRAGQARTYLMELTLEEVAGATRKGSRTESSLRLALDWYRWVSPYDMVSSFGSLGRFRERNGALGIAATHLEGPRFQLDIRPTMGPGAAWGDVDGDGLVDLYLVQGGGREGSAVPRNRLYKNKGDGTFADITGASNTGDQGAGMGALFCDLDSDGHLDLYVANYGRDVLYWNDGEGVFTRAADGVIPDHDLWSAGVAASDYDKDGDLDLYITSYLDYDESKMPPMDELERYQREDPVAMLPFAFPGQRNVFLRNDRNEDGSRHFSDVTEELGLLDVQGRGMQAIFWDFDQDGDDDLYVANDVSYNTLFRNEGDGTFRDVTFLVGLDDPRGGMGLTVGDVDRDGDEDLFLTNWQLEANALYQNNLINRAGRKLHTGTFADHTVQSRLGPAGIGVTSWGCELFDADNDGDLDLFVANGYTSPDYESTGICVGQPNHFFLNDGRGRFREAFQEGGMALAERLPSRGAVACDYDQDGLLDVLVTANNSRVQLLRNRGKSLGHWINLRLAGSNGNTFAVGARVHAKCGDDTFVASLRAGTGYLTGNAPELHLGLGNHAQVDELTIHWPSGRVTTHRDIAVDRFHSIREPD